jgi:hypothetical protein
MPLVEASASLLTSKSFVPARFRIVEMPSSFSMWFF